MSAHHLFEKGINLAPVAESEECNSSTKAPGVRIQGSDVYISSYLSSCAFAIDPFTPQALDVAKNPPRLPCDGIRVRTALKDASTLGQTSSRETNSLDADGLHHDCRMPTDLFSISSHQCIHCSFIWSHARY